MCGEAGVDIARSYIEVADFLLLDSYRSTDKQIGALGVPHDWAISRRIVDLVSIPVILAGGLGSDRCACVVRQLNIPSARLKMAEYLCGSSLTQPMDLAFQRLPVGRNPRVSVGGHVVLRRIVSIRRGQKYP